MKVKICGITDEMTANAAVQIGADAIGFVFAESKRKIGIEQAKRIVCHLPSNVMKVGVFVNESKEEIERIATKVGLTHVQLHGEETPDFCSSLSVPVIKALSVETGNKLKDVDQYPCEYILLDGPKGKYQGGNGFAFDWTILKDRKFQDKKIILAGGLNENNVEEAIVKINPYMVDVSSGVETDGKKDLQKITAFIAKAKGSLTGRKIQ